MEKKAKHNPVQKSTDKVKSRLFDIVSTNTEAEIRIGIAIADEEVKEESRRRRLEAPPSFEERIFLHSER
ncbi:hypothetical protein CCY01nite_17930 [Chitinophaga cymbidii]|uniref:Uncharacterized protein n=1 Tax=Chitinophaga cymbidii TaxID=1096750 RepID=A0A512RIK5_9BACT|nr:hypothetical protein CCY01nite_17930 [Chitinophaga cymbidii]